MGDEVRCADFVGLSSYGTAACSVVDAVSVRAKVDELVGPDYEAVGGGGGRQGTRIMLEGVLTLSVNLPIELWVCWILIYILIT